MNALRFLPSLAVVLIASRPATRAATYQVGPDRDVKALNEVSKKLKPGDVVEVDSARYTGQITFQNPGTAENRITIRGLRVGGHLPLLATAGTVKGGAVVRFLADHYVFEGFDVSGERDPLTARGLYVVADDITIRDTIVHDVKGQGIHGSDIAGSLTLDGVEIHHCGDGAFAHQIYVATNNRKFPAAAFRMQSCYVHDGTGGNNVKSRAGRSEIYYNWIEGAAYHELDLIGADPKGQGPDSANLVREDADIVGNVLRKRAGSGGVIARLGDDATGASNGRYRFLNNTIVIDPSWSGPATVLRLKGAVESLEFSNNVVAYKTGLRLVDGIQAIERPGTGSSGANNWVPRGTKSVPSTFANTISGTDPGFANESALDYTPASKSPLLNAGTLSARSPTGFAFPSPLTVPLQQARTPAAGSRSRSADSATDIGAFGSTVSPENKARP